MKIDKNIKHVIFDVYGTLISTGTGSVDATRKIFENLNVSDPPELIYAEWKKKHKMNMQSLEEFACERDIFVMDLKQLFLEYGIDNSAEVCVKPMLDSLYNRSLFDDTEETIKYLLGKYNVAIGSTTDDDPLLSNMKGTILEDIPNVFTSENLMVYKPQKEFYQKILQATGWKAEECLFVGDSIDDDVNGPLKAGMNACLVDRKGRDVILDKNVLKICELRELCDIL